MAIGPDGPNARVIVREPSPRRLCTLVAAFVLPDECVVVARVDGARVNDDRERFIDGPPSPLLTADEFREVQLVEGEGESPVLPSHPAVRDTVPFQCDRQDLRGLNDLNGPFGVGPGVAPLAEVPVAPCRATLLPCPAQRPLEAPT